MSTSFQGKKIQIQFYKTIFTNYNELYLILRIRHSNSLKYNIFLITPINFMLNFAFLWFERRLQKFSKKIKPHKKTLNCFELVFLLYISALFSLPLSISIVLSQTLVFCGNHGQNKSDIWKIHFTPNAIKFSVISLLYGRGLVRKSFTIQQKLVSINESRF